MKEILKPLNQQTESQIETLSKKRWKEKIGSFRCGRQIRIRRVDSKGAGGKEVAVNKWGVEGEMKKKAASD